MTTLNNDELKKLLVQAMYKWQDGWRFCSERLADAKWAKKTGLYPFHLVYSDDCACQITVDMDSEYFGGSCGCECHKKTVELAEIIAPDVAQLIATHDQQLLEAILEGLRGKVIPCNTDGEGQLAETLFRDFEEHVKSVFNKEGE